MEIAVVRLRGRGYGLAEQEAELGVTAVAVAILGADGAALGSVSVAGRPQGRKSPFAGTGSWAAAADSRSLTT